jgi:hypothetical protein
MGEGPNPCPTDAESHDEAPRSPASLAAMAAQAYSQLRGQAQDRLCRHALGLLLQAQSMNLLPRIGEPGEMMQAQVPALHVAATLDEDSFTNLVRVMQRAAVVMQDRRRLPDTHAPLPQDLHLGRVPARARGVATDLAWRYPGDHRISVLAAAALVPRLALLLGLVTPAALNLANHIIERRENGVTLHHLDPDQEPEMLDQDRLLGTDVWHANIHLASRCQDPKWNGFRVFSIGVPHQPLDPVTQEPSTALPCYDDWPVVGIRLEQITYSTRAPKKDQPAIGRDSLRVHYQLYHPNHQLPPSECARSPISPQVPMPIIISAPNPHFTFQQRTLILADGDRAQPFGITNENRRSWISSRLVDRSTLAWSRSPTLPACSAWRAWTSTAHGW